MAKKSIKSKHDPFESLKANPKAEERYFKGMELEREQHNKYLRQKAKQEFQGKIFGFIVTVIIIALIFYFA